MSGLSCAVVKGGGELPLDRLILALPWIVLLLAYWTWLCWHFRTPWPKDEGR